METITAAATETTAAVYVDPYPGRKGSDRLIEDCAYCAGSGIYSGRSGHTFHTVTVGFATTGCFRCHGTGKHSRLVSTARANERRRVKEANARAAKAANPDREFNEALAAAVAFDASLVALAQESTNYFIESLRQQMHRRHLSEKQLAAAVKSIAKDAEFAATRAAEAESKQDAPEGRMVIKGTIATMKLQESMYGSTYKMLVKAEGDFTVWGTVPASMWDSLQELKGGDDYYTGDDFKGCTVQFTATLKRADNDSTHAYFTRPTKATITALPAAE